MRTLGIAALLLFCFPVATSLLAGPAGGPGATAPGRWALSVPAGARALAWGGFDPRLHTPNFSNDQAVHWTEAAGQDDDAVQRAYHGGLCWGICELAHLYFREFTRRDQPSAGLRAAFYGCVFPGLPVPPPGDPARHLRQLCQSSAATRERVCAITAALQLDSPPDPRTVPPDAAGFVAHIVASIRRDGTAVVHTQRVDPTRGFRHVTGHNLLAYLAFEAIAVGSGRRVPVIAIRCWDPMLPYPSASAGRSRGAAADRGPGELALIRDKGLAANPEAVLLYDPATQLFTFTADYLARKTFRPPDVRAGREVLQPAEALVPGRDLVLRRPDTPTGAAILSAAIGTTKRTAVALDVWPETPRGTVTLND